MVNTIVGQSLSYRLAQCLLSYCCTPCSTTGMPLFEFFLKRTLRTRLDIMKPVVSKVVTQNQASTCAEMQIVFVFLNFVP